MPSGTPFALRSWLVHATVYCLFRTVIAVVCMFPPRMAKRIGRFLGRLGYAIDRKRREIAHRNLSLAEGWPKDRRAQARFIRRVFEHLGISAVEDLMLPRALLSRGFLDSTVFENFDLINQIMERGRGAIIAIAHLGNWEWIGLAVCMRGYPLRSIARPVDNPFIDRYINRFRTLTGQRIIPKFDAIKSMVEVIKRNELLVILADQDARGAGLTVPFFGHPASTVKSPALLSLRHGSPIVPVEIWRDDAGRHHVRITPPLQAPDGASLDEGVHALTAAMNQRFEQFVRAHPTQWMWLHPRWKTAAKAMKETGDRAIGSSGDPGETARVGSMARSPDDAI